ncbi:polysaccharide deacetylase family protein [[Kitasatospora] papulosa]|uniref:polysaccharide deacetylase family protein n=1 Tax=[Kitasatospora] papulosa TaxID=1464011 RepID=UPI002E332E92|nr:polysaccharide deacetylase family protein [[Kitasatospora] papulosa]
MTPFRPGLAAALVTVLTLTLGGCAMGTTAPASARADAASDAKGSFGLTFDAGPAKDTPRLLDVLKEKRVPAKFFLLGRDHVLKHPETVRRIEDEGHEVANHTWSHEILTDKEPGEIRAELERTQLAIEDVTGKRPRLMRPPQGRTDATVSEVCEELGLSQVLWSATAKDYSTNDSALIRKRILDQAGKDGIILLHDIYEGTVPAVPGIIDTLKERGYTFVTVPQLMAPAEPRPGTVYRP